MRPKRASTKQTEVFSERLSGLVEEIKEKEKDKGRSLGNNQIAEEIVITKGQLSKYLSDKTEIGINALAKIADYFDCSIDYLLGWSNYKSLSDSRKIAAKTLGLSEKAIFFMQKMKDTDLGIFHLDLLSYLIEHKDMEKILTHLVSIMTVVFRQYFVTGLEKSLLFSESNEYDFSKIIINIYRDICENEMQHFFEQSKTFESEIPKNLKTLNILKGQIETAIEGLNNGKGITITQQDFNAALVRYRLKAEDNSQ